MPTRARTGAMRARGWLAVLLITPLLAAADERILSFDSNIRVHADSTMTVRETIKVRAEGNQIKRGIYRDFPTRYRDAMGNGYSVDFRVIAVERDGRPEPWHRKRRTNGERVYVGEQDVLLRAGVYTYTITYRTDRQLGYFADRDELYWNVTGNGWAFPIDRATASVSLPAPVPVASLRLEAYTGPQGAAGRRYSAHAEAPGHAVFATSAPLGSYEGLTIVLGWPKGIVRQPDAFTRTRNFARDNPGFLIGIAGLLLVLGYYLAVWHRFGRDPEKGVVVPQFTPPHDLSPAALRYIERMGFDHKAFTAALLNLAVKGYLTIAQEGKHYTLRKRPGGDVTRLTARELKVAEELFGQADSIALLNSSHRRLSAATQRLRSLLSREYHKVYFVTNRGYLVAGIVLTVAAVLLAGFADAHDREGFLGIAVWLFGWTAGVVFLWVSRQFMMATLFSLFEFVGLFAMTEMTAPWVVVLFALLVAINVLFYFLLKAPSRAGRKVMDAIAGFRMYLAIAEKDRLDLLHPPERTPELFEKYLPYAFALGVEQQWSEHFADVLARAGHDPSAYSPSWYHGSGWNRMGVRGFGSALGASLSSAVAAASTAPGSRSGGGGGGSSGGGGGGGGGGGW